MMAAVSSVRARQLLRAGAKKLPPQLQADDRCTSGRLARAGTHSNTPVTSRPRIQLELAVSIKCESRTLDVIRSIRNGVEHVHR
jgi:hypothetical protein